jgi:hypothetical protein
MRRLSSTGTGQPRSDCTPPLGQIQDGHRSTIVIAVCGRVPAAQAAARPFVLGHDRASASAAAQRWEADRGVRRFVWFRETTTPSLVAVRCLSPLERWPRPAHSRAGGSPGLLFRCFIVETGRVIRKQKNDRGRAAALPGPVRVARNRSKQDKGKGPFPEGLFPPPRLAGTVQKEAADGLTRQGGSPTFPAPVAGAPREMRTRPGNNSSKSCGRCVHAWRGRKRARTTERKSPTRRPGQRPAASPKATGGTSRDGRRKSSRPSSITSP